MIVEFLGVPGAGKTSLVPYTVDWFNEYGFKAFRPRKAGEYFFHRSQPGKLITKLTPHSFQVKLARQLFYRFSLPYQYKFDWDFPGLLDWIASQQQNRPEDAQAGERKIYENYRRLAGYYSFITSRLSSDETVVFDEGLVHRSIQLFVSYVERPSKTKLWGYLDSIPQPDLVIIVKAPLDVCRERIYRRGLWSHFHGKNRDQLTSFLSNANDAVALTAERMRNKEWNMIELVNHHDFQSTINNLHDQLYQAIYEENVSMDEIHMLPESRQLSVKP